METQSILILSGLLIALVVFAVLITLHKRAEGLKMLNKTGAGENYFINYVPAALTPSLYMIAPGVALIALLYFVFHSSNSIWYIPALIWTLAGIVALVPYIYSKGKQLQWAVLPSWLRVTTYSAWRIALSAWLIVTVIYIHDKTEALTVLVVGIASAVIMARLLLIRPPALMETSTNTAELARVQSITKSVSWVMNLEAVIRLTIFVTSVAWLLWWFVETSVLVRP